MTKYSVMRKHIDSSSGVAETRAMIWRDGLFREEADQMAEFHNTCNHRRPMHPALVVPGEGIFHEPDKLSVAAYEE